MSNRSKALLLILGDLGILFLCLVVVVKLRLGDLYLPQHYDLFSYLFPLWLLAYFIEGLYSLRTFNPATLPVSLLRGTFMALVLTTLVTYVLVPQIKIISPKTNLVLIALLALPILYAWKRLFFYVFSHASRLRNTVLIGCPSTLEMVKFEINRKPFLGYKIQEHITAETELIAIERNLKAGDEVYSKVFSHLESGIEVMDLACFAEKISGKIPINSIDQSWFIEFCGHHESRSFDILKTAIDRAIAVIILLLFIPIALILFPIMLLTQGAPIFFTQERVGLHNKNFRVYKLRTMINSAEKDGPQWATAKDCRVTLIGKLLRKTRLDEIPQVINILKGEMSLIGPRPERPEFIKAILTKDIPFYNLRHLVKPGITGWAQVTFRYGSSVQDSLEKLQFDLFYIKNKSIWLEVVIALKTIRTIISGTGV